MFKKICNWLLSCLLVLLVAGGLFSVGMLVSGEMNKPLSPGQTPNAELLAITETGTRVYRVNDKKAIVPVVWVESRSGHISMR